MSGIPVHINGFFAVSSNRHQLKWPSIRHTDDSGAKVGVTDKACLWNELVLEEVRKRQSECIYDEIMHNDTCMCYELWRFLTVRNW